MSELELSMFRQRSQEALKQKARRGALVLGVAAGYVKIGVCFLATATRLFGANDIARLYSWDAWRLGETISELLVARCACVQAVSKAAPRITASRCTTLRTPEAEAKGAPIQIRLVARFIQIEG